MPTQDKGTLASSVLDIKEQDVKEVLNNFLNCSKNKRMFIKISGKNETMGKINNNKKILEEPNRTTRIKGTVIKK